MMSKALLATAAGGAIVGGVLLAARARRAQSAAAVVPVDDELNAVPYAVDANRAHALKLDEDARRPVPHLLERHQKVQTVSTTTTSTTQPPPGIGVSTMTDAVGRSAAAGSAPPVSPSGDALRQRELLFEELLDASSAKKMRGQFEYERQRALKAQQEAQTVAAEASAAAAAAALLKSKEQEHLQRSSEEARVAAELEEAANARLRDAMAAKKAAVKERVYAMEAEAQASRRLKKQEHLMHEAAKHEEQARNTIAVAEAKCARELQEEEAAARERAAAAEKERAREAQRLEAERRAVQEAEERLAADRRLVEQQQAAIRRAKETATAAEAREHTAEKALEEARMALLNAHKEREGAERDAKLHSKELADIDRHVQQVLADLHKHETAVERARAATERAVVTESAAEANANTAHSALSRFTAWWHTDTASRPTITAVAESKGDAVVVPPSNAAAASRRPGDIVVDAAGTATVSLVETPAPVLGGRENAAVDAAVVNNGSEAQSNIKMAKSARALK